MLTLNALCSDIEASGRHLSPRAARDWWTKGLLPRPCRRGLGRGKGTETFWTTPGVFQQARAAYDLLARHSRADIALLNLWIMGFSVDLRSIRVVYLKLIKGHLREVHGHARKRPDDIVGGLAAMVARQQVNNDGALVDAQEAYAELADEFMEIFYGIEGERVSEGLAKLWEKAAPYIGRPASSSGGLAEWHPRDEDLATWAKHLEQFLSLPAQLKMIRTASDYELIRARRLVRFMLGYLRRIESALACRNDFEEFGFRHLIGRMAVPILIAALREDTLRNTIMSWLLDTLQKLPPQAEWPALIGKVGSPATQRH